MNEPFDEIKLQQTVKKAKRKSILKTVLIALIVFIIGSIGNIVFTILLSHWSFDREKAMIELSIPNGFISSTYETIGFLGGTRMYKISKTVGPKTVMLEERRTGYGLFPFMSRGQGKGGHEAGEWPINYWENGDRKMMFFHPEIQYKEYKNDLAELNKLPDGAWIEMAVSFDRPYNLNEQDTLLPSTINWSWLWLDTYSKKDIETFKKEVKEYDPKACFINEHEVTGLEMRSKYMYAADYKGEYKNLLEKLQKSPNQRHQETYKLLKKRGYDDYTNVKILGAIVYGTKEDLKALQNNPIVKATSFGVITDKY